MPFCPSIYEIFVSATSIFLSPIFFVLENTLWSVHDGSRFILMAVVYSITDHISNDSRLFEIRRALSPQSSMLRLNSVTVAASGVRLLRSFFELVDYVPPSSLILSTRLGLICGNVSEELCPIVLEHSFFSLLLVASSDCLSLLRS